MIWLLLMSLIGAAMSSKSTPESKRKAVLDAARAELGKTDPTPYEVSVLGYKSGKVSWCGIFALAMLRKVGLTNWLWELGRGFLYRLPQTKDPKPGDLFYMNALQHHGIVEDILPDGRVVTLNGNSDGGAVARVVREPSTIAAYYSIEPLVRSV